VPRLRTIFTIHWPLIVKVTELGFGISKLKKTLPLLLNAAPDNASGKNDTFCVTSPRWPLTSFNDHGPLTLRISCVSSWKSVSETPLPEIGPEQPKSAAILATLLPILNDIDAVPYDVRTLSTCAAINQSSAFVSAATAASRCN